jgi:hypothetical protein
LLLIVGGNQAFLLLHPVPVFRLCRDVRIIIKYRDGKILAKILQTIAAAGCTAAVQKESPHSPRILCIQYLFQFLLIIGLIHPSTPI